MSKVDIIIFGASGFTGEFIAKEISNIHSDKYTFALAGRTESKLKAINDKLPNKASKIIVADVKNEKSLIEMCEQGRVMISAVGPYRFYGLAVMEACLKASCHYVDISGEPWFIESAEYKFDKLAKKNNVYAISACGFDSIPSDMGVEFTRKELVKKYGVDAKLNEVHAYLHGNTGGRGYTAHATTLECAVHGFSSAKDLIKLRKEIVKENPLIPNSGKKGRLQKDFHKVPISPNNSDNRYGIKFMGSDRSIVLRSQQLIAKNLKEHANTVQFFMYVSLKNTFMNKVKTYLFGAIMGILTGFSWGRKMIINYPYVMSIGGFSHEGPSKEQVENAVFEIDFTGKSMDGEVIYTKVMGPDPGYIGTAAMVSTAAVTILEDLEKLPAGGGVMTTAYAFRDSGIYERLAKRGVKYSVC